MTTEAWVGVIFVSLFIVGTILWGKVLNQDD
jgi:hypothetical protein